MGQILVHPLGPGIPAQVMLLAGHFGGTLLGVLPADLDMAELGVGHQDAVGKEGTADAGAECEEQNGAAHAVAGPEFISAAPAASASFSTVADSLVVASKALAASTPIQPWSTFAAVWTTPSTTTPGKVRPTGPVQAKSCTRRAATSMTASGVAGWGVWIFCRSAVSWPVDVSTGAALMPVPPISMPRTCAIACLRFAGPSDKPTASVARGPYIDIRSPWMAVSPVRCR